MNRKFSLRGVVSMVVIFATCTFSLIGNTGGSPAGFTNAPSEGNCATGCHGGVLQTSGVNYNNVSLTGNFVGGGYIPDSTYTITLTYTHTGRQKFGYQLTCLDSLNVFAGRFSILAGNNKSRISNRLIQGSNRSYMNHTFNGTSGPGSISWEFEWTAPSTNRGDVTFYTVLNSSNSNGSTSGDEIIGREFKIPPYIPQNTTPEAVAAAVDSTICAGSKVSLLGSGTNSPTSWSWSIPNGNPSVSTDQNPMITLASPGTHYAILTATNATGTSVPDTLEIEVLDTPMAIISGPSTYTICEGDSVELVANNGVGYSYTWIDGTQGRSFWAKSEGEYYVNVENSAGCSSVSNRVEIIHYAKPQAMLLVDSSSQNDTLCAMSSILLSAGAGTSLSDSFFFYENDSLIARSTDSYVGVQFEKRTIYGLEVVDSFGCRSDRDDYLVEAAQRNAAPNLRCVSTSANSIDFEWTSLTAHTGFEVSLDSGMNWTTPSSGPLGTLHSVTGLNPGDTVTLYVRALDDSPCEFSEVSSATCVSQICDPLYISAVYDSSICIGDLWEVEVNGLSSANYSLSLDGGNTFTDTIFYLNPTQSTVYTLEIIDSSRLLCPVQTLELDLTVDVLVDIQLESNKIGDFCEGEEITFSANDSLENFDFYLNDSIIQSGPANEFIFSDFMDRDSTYVVVTKGSCIDTSEVEYISVELPANTEFTYDRDGTIYTFTPIRQDYPSYVWDFGDGSAESTDVIAVHDYALVEGSTVNVNLSITTLANCQADTSISVLLPELSNVKDLERIGVNVYPNPANDFFIVSNTDNKELNIQILTSTGEILDSQKLGIGENQISIADYSPGVLIIRILTDRELTHFSLIKR